MARRRQERADFESLINTLQQQNEGQLAAQQETTKNVRNLHAYFLRKDRVETRRRLEEEMEAGPEQVGSDGKPKGRGFKLGRIPSKGILGKFLEFLITGALGAKGAGLFKGLFNSLKFSKGFGITFLRLFGAALLLPDLWNAVSEAFKQEDIKGGITTFIDTFFGGKEGVSFAEKIAGATMKGALLGLVALGPKGAIAGGLLAGALVGISTMMGQDKLDSNKIYEAFKKYFTDGSFKKDIGGPAVGAGVGAMLGALIGSGVGPQGMIAGAVIGGAIGGIGGMINTIWNNYDEQKGNKSISDAFFKALKDNPKISAMLIVGGLGAGLLGTIGGVPGIILGAIAGAIIGPTLVAIGQWIASLDIGPFIGDVIEKAKKQLQRVKSAGMASLSGDFEESEKILSGEWAIDMKELAKKKKAGMNEIEYMNNLAYLSGVDLSGMTKRLQSLEEYKNLPLTDFAKPIQEFEKLMKAKQAEIGEPLKGIEIKELLTDFMKQNNYGMHGVRTNQSVRSTLQRKFIDNPKEERILRNEINEITTNIQQGIPLVENARGSQVYRKPTLALVAEKPGSTEYIMSDKNLKRLADTIATQRENQTLSTMMPMMMGGGGGGASMPVFNNSYSYQNVDNIVAELPTTSSINMSNALA